MRGFSFEAGSGLIVLCLDFLRGGAVSLPLACNLSAMDEDRLFLALYVAGSALVVALTAAALFW